MRRLLVALAVAANAGAQDSVRVDTLARGVVHRTLVRAAMGDTKGPWRVHVLEVDLRRRDVRVEAAHAPSGTALVGRARPSEVTRAVDSAWCRGGRRVLAAVNGDLFDLATGENESNQVVAGEILKAMPTTDSPFDARDNAHAEFALDARGRPLIERFAFDGLLVAGRDTARLDGVNARRGGAAVLFTPRAGSGTPDDTVADRARGSRHERAYEVRGRRGEALRLRALGTARAGGGTPIPPNGVVLSVADSAAAARFLGDGAPRDVTAVLRFAPDRGPLRALVGGWGRLVAEGENVAARSDSAEFILDSFTHRRHPRTAVGFSRDSSTLYVVTVDGRQKTSVGMTLVELAELMRSLGAWDATNFDGGGSTAMIVGGRLASVPSDSVGERTVGNVLLVARNERRKDCAR